MNFGYKNFFLPVGLLTGAIIGAGIFSLPYTFKISGLPLGFFYLSLAAIAYSLVHLFYADVIIRTPERHRFVGYVRQYLGEGAGVLAAFLGIVEMLFVLTIYLILSVSFTNLVFGGDLILKIIIFWVLGSLGIFMNLRRLALIESAITVGMVGIVAGIFIISLSKIAPGLLSGAPKDFLSSLAPLPPILFALSGRVAISILVDYFRDQGALTGRGVDVSALRRVIVGATTLSAVVYGLFVIGIVSISPVVTEDAVTGLTTSVAPLILFFIGILGMLSLFSSYIVIGADVKNILQDDARFPVWAAVTAVISAPVFLYFVGFKEFLPLVGFVGGILLSLEGIILTLMWGKANSTIAEPSQIFSGGARRISAFTIAVFSIALIYEIIKNIN